jgi:outer membrane protein OmpA-like peptidoglycan-associated protein
MRLLERAGTAAVLAAIVALPGCSWVSGWFGNSDTSNQPTSTRQKEPGEINDPGADITFGIKRDQTQPGTPAAGAGGNAPAAGTAATKTEAGRDAAAGAGAAAKGAKVTPLGNGDAGPGTPIDAPGKTAAGQAAPGAAAGGTSTNASGGAKTTPAAGGAPEKDMTAMQEVAPGTPMPGDAAGPVLEKTAIQGDALFQFGRSDIEGMGSAGTQKLDQIAERIKAMNAAELGMVEVLGHADRLGSKLGNKRLSERRAATVANYLVSKGVNSSIIKSAGKGDADPIVQCKGTGVNPQLVACLEPNRRVEVVIRGK